MNLNFKKPMEIILIAILVLILFAVIWGAYENMKTVRASTNELDKGIDEVIRDWIEADSRDTAMLKEIDKKLTDSEARIDRLIKEAEAVFGD